MELAIWRRWLALCALGCAAPALPPGPVQEALGAGVAAPGSESSLQRAAEAPVASFEGGFRSVEAVGQGLELPLPDAQGWRRDARDKQNWVARHRRTASTLVVRAWDHAELARIENCERQARSWRPELPQAAREELLDQREQLLAGAYQSRVVLFVRAATPAPGGRLEGHALAFGSDARSCLMLAFSTTASGPRATDEIAERLSVVLEAVFGRARRVGIGERVVVPRM
jgi:hypothetical protein